MNKDKKKKKKAYIYTRVSTGMQVEGYSLDAQKDNLHKYAELEDMEIIREFSDEGYSGKSIEGRPEFKRMIEYVRAGEQVDFILVYKLSRFGRNTADVLSTVQELQDFGVNLICKEDGIDTSKETGKLLLSILSAVYELERENILNQTMAGRREKARKGLWNGGFAPYGYKLENGQLIVVPEEAEVVKLIYDLYYKERRGMTAIAGILNDRGYTKKNNNKGHLNYFTSHFIKGVLDNPVYAGKIAFGRRRMEKVDGTRNDYHAVKQDEYQLSDGVHVAIIDESLWNSVHQRRLETGVRQEKRYSKDRKHLLTGLLKCPICGANMYGNVNRKKKKKGENEYYKDIFYYCCKHRKDAALGKKCDYNRQFNQERVDTEVLDILIDVCNNEEYIKKVRQKMTESIDTTAMEIELKGLQDTKLSKEKLIKNINLQFDKLDANDSMYERKYSDLEKRLDKAYRDLETIEVEISLLDSKIQAVIRNEASMRDALYHILDDIKSWPLKTDQEKRDVIRHFIKEIEIFPYPEKEERIVKNVKFQFPIQYLQNGIVDEIRWDKEGRVETVVLMSRVKD